MVIKAAEYRRLKKRDREALRVEELSEAEIAAIKAEVPPAEAADFDHEVET